MSFQFMKKSIEELKQDLLDKECGVVGQWQDYPTNWEEMQTADIDEMEQVKLEQIKQDNREPIEEESEERQYGISRADTL